MKKFLHYRLIPPVADIISRVKCTCSISMIRSMYSLFFSFSLSSNIFEMSWLAYLLVFGLKKLASKNVADLSVCQKSLAQISKSTLFSVRVDDRRVSPVSRCKWCSTQIYLHTSFDSLAVIFWIWLWCIVIKPPFLNCRACCRSNLAMHSHSSSESPHIYDLNRIPKYMFCWLIDLFRS